MRKIKNQGKKTLTAVGAVVVGLTPGIIAATPQCAPSQNPNAAITAADVVSIGGNTYDYDELYDMQVRADGPKQAKKKKEQRQHATRYGAPSGPSLPYRPNPNADNSSVPHPQRPVDVVPVVVMTPSGPETVYVSSLAYLMNYCARLADSDPYTRGAVITPDSDLSTEIGLNDRQLKALKTEIEERFGVEVSYNRFYLKGQLNTLRLISEYIYKLKTLWD